VLNDFGQLLQVCCAKLLNDQLEVKLRNVTRMRVWGNWYQDGRRRVPS